MKLEMFSLAAGAAAGSLSLGYSQSRKCLRGEEVLGVIHFLFWSTISYALGGYYMNPQENQIDKMVAYEAMYANLSTHLMHQLIRPGDSIQRALLSLSFGMALTGVGSKIVKYELELLYKAARKFSSGRVIFIAGTALILTGVLNLPLLYFRR